MSGLEKVKLFVTILAIKCLMNIICKIKICKFAQAKNYEKNIFNRNDHCFCKTIICTS